MLKRIEHTERDSAVTALRAFITQGGYAPGDRLPPERELIGSLSMTRNTLRKALDAMEREGAIWRHVGKGTFVAQPSVQGTGAAPASGTIADLSRQLGPARVMRARLCIEPSIAREAAINASDEAITRIRHARDRAAEAETWDEYEARDDKMHRAVAEAADNLLLLTLFDQLNQVRRAVAWNIVIRQTARPPRGHSSFAEHDRIVDAIEARNPAAAHEAMRKHLASVSARLFGET